MIERPDLIFECRKCHHLLYVAKKEFFKKLESILHEPCPNCYEEGGGFWILKGEGNYDSEFK